VSLIGGSVSAIIGVLWSLLFINQLTDEAHNLVATQDEYGKQIAALNAAASEYFIANQQGDLIFILATQGNARQDLAALIYRGNMLDRATPVRNMIGALAIARQLDYRETYDSFEKLNDEARANLTATTFFAVKAREKEIIDKGQSLAASLLARQFEARKAINDNDAAQHRARVFGGILSVASTVLLLFANVFTKRFGS